MSETELHILRTHNRGRNLTPGYHCAGTEIVQGRGVYCLNVGGLQIDEAVTEAFLEALEPAGIEAAFIAAQQLETDHDAALALCSARNGVVLSRYLRIQITEI